MVTSRQEMFTELAISRFLDATNLHLEILASHTDRIRKLHASAEWSALRKEHSNAGVTMRQLVHDLQQISSARGHLLDSFERRVADVAAQVSASVRLFEDVRHACVLPSADDRQQQQSASAAALPPSQAINAAECELLQQQCEHLLQLTVLLSSAVHTQREQVDSIKAHTSCACEQVEQAAKHLRCSSKLNYAALPLSGAAIGCLIGGPVGLLAGLKLGALAAVGGTIAGGLSGHLLKKRWRKEKRD